MMKGAMKISRLIRPRQAFSPDDTGSTKAKDAAASPTTDAVVVTAPVRDFAVDIEDFVSNLEQTYDSSLSKWDDLRKMEAREHALMQGTMLPEQLNTEIPGTKRANNSIKIHKETKDDDFDDDDDDDVQQFLISADFSSGAKKSSFMSKEVTHFILWALLLLGWLKLFAILRR
jgi:hypothetical protein